ncbi:MAG TPA: hypothetical protein DG753_04895, partial [Clostridium sp.]|nr:hypothetical protein [Clostridium sp.]
MFCIIFAILSIIYCGLMIFSAIKECKDSLCKKLFILGSIIVLISNLGIILSAMRFIVILFMGIILINSSAVLNGYKLYGKPHWKHHISREIYSLIR